MSFTGIFERGKALIRKLSVRLDKGLPEGSSASVFRRCPWLGLLRLPRTSVLVTVICSRDTWYLAGFSGGQSLDIFPLWNIPSSTIKHPLGLQAELHDQLNTMYKRGSFPQGQVTSLCEFIQVYTRLYRYLHGCHVTRTLQLWKPLPTHCHVKAFPSLGLLWWRWPGSWKTFMVVDSNFFFISNSWPRSTKYFVLFVFFF